MALFNVDIRHKSGKENIVPDALSRKHQFRVVYVGVSQPYFGPSVGVKPNTPKVGNLESSGTPECSELDNKAQNTSH